MSIEKPFAITAGDASGVGPEILLKAFHDGDLPWPFIAYGDLEALRFYNDRLGYGVNLNATGDSLRCEAGALNVLNHALLQHHQITPGKLNRAAGHAAYAYVVSATQAALAGKVRAVVTLPINKEATCLSHPGFTGHTELIGELCGSSDVTIMLVSNQLIVTHVTTHMSLAHAIQHAKQARIQTIIQLTAEAVGKLKTNARIAVAGLNPHAGENGLFGDEEIREIAPAVEWAKKQGYPVEGPMAPDTLFYLAVRRKKFDAIVCMYHDQGHVPLKLLDFEGGVNVALGLPIVRTSVDHGTAFDIAGTGVASTRSLIRAMELAGRLSTPPGEA